MPENIENRNTAEKLEHASFESLTVKWISACNLKQGDRVLLSNGSYGTVESVKLEKLATPETTYNFEVDDFHTYYVGEQSVCVHNANCGFERLYNNPEELIGKSADEVGDILGSDFKRTLYGSKRDGWRYMDRHGNKVVFHPSGGKHTTAYYILQKEQIKGRLKLIGQGYNKLGELNTIYHVIDDIL